MKNNPRIAALWAALGKRFDPMRTKWGGMPRGDRVVLAIAAGQPRSCGYMEWDALQPGTQNTIAAAYARMLEHVKGWEGVQA